jgi:hypothetical protein
VADRLEVRDLMRTIAGLVAEKTAAAKTTAALTREVDSLRFAKGISDTARDMALGMVAELRAELAAAQAGLTHLSIASSGFRYAIRTLRDDWYQKPGWSDAADALDAAIDAFGEAFEGTHETSLEADLATARDDLARSRARSDEQVEKLRKRAAENDNLRADLAAARAELEHRRSACPVHGVDDGNRPKDADHA